MIRAICFDFDGVLAPLVDIHRKAFIDALAEHGVDVTPEYHDGELDGLSTKEKMRRLLACGFAFDAGAAWVRKQEMTREAIRGFEPDPVKIGMLRRLKEVYGLPLACVSNSIRSTTLGFLRQAGLMEFFDFVLSNEDVPEQKPSPVPYFMAFQQLGVEPSEALIVEDQPQGIESAKRSGGVLCITNSYDEVTWDWMVGCIDRANAQARLT